MTGRIRREVVVRVRQRTEVEALVGLPLFVGCRPRELRRIAALAERWVARAGELLLHERYRGEQVHVVLEGTLAVTRRGLPVAMVGPGGVIGERGVLLGADRNATVVAETRAVLLTFGLDGFGRLMREHPRIAARIYEQAAAHGPSSAG